jgi:hypothetical protein
MADQAIHWGASLTLMGSCEDRQTVGSQVEDVAFRRVEAYAPQLRVRLSPAFAHLDRSNCRDEEKYSVRLTDVTSIPLWNRSATQYCSESREVCAPAFRPDLIHVYCPPVDIDGRTTTSYVVYLASYNTRRQTKVP